MKKINVENIKQSFSGQIISPEDKDYSNLQNALFSQGSPAVIFQPKTAEDVATALQFVKANKLVVSIRCGGHSGAGFSTNTDGAVIEMSHLDTIELIDKEKHLVKIGGGAKWIDVANKLKEYGLALSSGDTKSVGVGGLTLGGGIGWMVRKYGLAIDSLRAVEIVTADGKIQRASESENSDLFWAIRGGGGNFGVVTHFEFEAHPTGEVYAGMIMFPLENLGPIIKGWRDIMRNADENLTTILNFFAGFGPEVPPAIMITCCYASDDETKAMAAIEPFTKLGKVLNNAVKKKPYAEVLEEAHPPQGVKIVTKNIFAKEFSDELIETIVSAQKMNPNLIMQIRILGGAMARVPSDATAFAFRDSEVMVLSPAFLPPNATPEQQKEAFKAWDIIAPFGNGAYTNFLTEPNEDLVKVYSESTFNKLVVVKKKYDPENLFNQNYNLMPGE